MNELQMCRSMREWDLSEMAPKCSDVDCVPLFFCPRVSALQIRLHVTPIDVIPYIVVDVAIESGFEGHDGDCG